jgi:hypothetical protein
MMITEKGDDLALSPPWLSRLINVLEYKHSDAERIMQVKEWKEAAKVPTGREEEHH